MICKWLSKKSSQKAINFAYQQYALFPRLRSEKEASQPAARQRRFFITTNMLVLVVGYQCGWKRISENFYPYKSA
jgi:hypothetical protein